MLLIIEIALTIAAFKRGWKWLACLPLAIAFGGGICLGFFSGLGRIDDGTMIVAALALDVMSIVILSVLCAMKPKAVQEKQQWTSQYSQPPHLSQPSNPFAPPTTGGGYRSIAK